MKIKRITNLKYSKSKKRHEIDISECIVLRNKLLSLSDWTQLPDTKLSRDTVNNWRVFRDKVRSINVDDPSNIHNNKEQLNHMMGYMEKIPIEYVPYDDLDVDIESAKRRLFKLICDVAEAQYMYLVSPNMDKLIAEITAILLERLGPSHAISSIDDVISKTESLFDNEGVMDYLRYPFLAIHLKYSHGKTLKETMLEILNIKKVQQDNTLQMEEFILKYTNRVKGCQTLSDLDMIENELRYINGHRY